MILTDREILLALSKKQIIIDPKPTLDCYSSTSVDLRLGPELTIFNDDIGAGAIERPIIDPSKQGYNAEREISKVSKPLHIPDEGYLLQPNTFILGYTNEVVDLPLEARLAARVEGKSSLARLGLLIHFTAPTIHAGFNKPIRLEIINMGPLVIRLRKEMKICQLVFELTLGTSDKAFVPVQTS